jgi:hypothetical protein
MGNHLHLKIRFKNTENVGKFLKSFSATLARAITGARRGKKFGKFWDGLVFTRVIKSKFEELGYRERERYLKAFNQFLYRLRREKAAPKPQDSWENAVLA